MRGNCAKMCAKAWDTPIHLLRLWPAKTLWKAMTGLTVLGEDIFIVDQPI